MKKWLSLFLCALSLLVSVGCGGSQEALNGPNVSVPDYAIVNHSEYVRNGKKCIGYRVEIGDDASEEEMRAVFSAVCKDDGYYLHTVWFYGIASDIDTIGMYTVGMLEETVKGVKPEFEKSIFEDEPELLTDMRERAAEIPEPTVTGGAKVTPTPEFTETPEQTGEVSYEALKEFLENFLSADDQVSSYEIGRETVVINKMADGLYAAVALLDGDDVVLEQWSTLIDIEKRFANEIEYVFTSCGYPMSATVNWVSDRNNNDILLSVTSTDILIDVVNGIGVDGPLKIPNPTPWHDAFVPDNEYYPVDKIIFSTTASENGLENTPYYVSGVVASRDIIKGYDTIALLTEYGTMYVSEFTLIRMPDFEIGSVQTVLFIYSGWSNVLDGPAGLFMYAL